MKLSKFGKFLIGLVAVTFALVAMKGLSFGQGQDIGTLPATSTTCSDDGSIFVTASGSTYISTWMSGGIERRVVTDRRANESAPSHAKRHKEDAEALLMLYPRDSVPTGPLPGTTSNGMEITTYWGWSVDHDPVLLPTSLTTRRYQDPLEPVNEWQARHREGLVWGRWYMPKS